MKPTSTATLTEAQNSWSTLIDRVRQGETILLLDRGRPVARIEPVHLPGEHTDGRLARLVRQGIVRPALSRPPRDVLERRPPSTMDNSSVVDALLEERRSGR